MPLFDGEIGDYTTPDGQRVSLPLGLAASFPGLQPVTPTAPPPIPPPVAIDQPAVPPPDQTAQPPAGPVTSPGQVPEGERLVPVTPSPRGPKPITNNDLNALGNAGAYNAAAGGFSAERGAVQRQGEATADQATAIGEAMAAADQHAAQLLEQRRQAAEENARVQQAMANDYQRKAMEVADTKIDRSLNHPVLGALSILLTGLGQALNRNSVIDATKPLYDAVDRKAAAQIQDLEVRRQALGIQRDAMGVQRQAGADRLAELDTFRLGYLEQAKRQIDTIRQQTTSPVVRANAELASAQVTQKQNEVLTQAIAREQQKREAAAARAQAAQQHRDQLALALRGQNIQIRGQDLQEKERLDALAERMLERNDKAGAARVKLLEEQGVRDPSTGDPMLTPEGLKKIAQADSYEAKARIATDPAKAKALSQMASDLRDSAHVNDSALATNKKSAEDTQKVLNAAHVVANLANAASDMLEGDPSMMNRTKWAELKAKLANIKARYVATLGERVSVRALEAFDDVLSIDPESMVSRMIDKDKAIGALKTLREDAAEHADTALKGAGIKTPWQPGHKEDAVSFGGKTARELADEAKPGILGAQPDPTQPEGPEAAALTAAQNRRLPPSAAEVQRAASKGETPLGEPSLYGLDPADDAKVRALVKRSASVGNRAYGDIIDTIKVPLENAQRPGLAEGVARLVHDEDPRLFAAVLAQLPPLRAKEIADAVDVAGGARPRHRELSDLAPDERAALETQRAAKATKTTTQKQQVDQKFLNTLPLEGRKRYLEYLRSNGFPGAE